MVNAEITKHFVTGALNGQTIIETLSFVDSKQAREWVLRVAKHRAILDYRVVNFSINDIK